jgi:type I restriction enzyme S subunit
MENNYKNTTWRKVRLGDVVTSGGSVSGPFGSSIHSKFYRPKGVPIIRGNNLSLAGQRGQYVDDDYMFLDSAKADELHHAHAVSGDIVITARGTLGQVGLIPSSALYPKYILSANQLRFRIDPDKADNKFVYYSLANKRMIRHIQSLSANVGVPNFNLGMARNLELYLPDVSTQTRIAEFLGTFDDKIEVNNKIIRNLEELAQTIFKEWFVKFRFPDYEKVKMVDSELGRIPEGWGITAIGTVCRIVGGGTPSTTVAKYWANGDVLWATPTDMTSLKSIFIDSTDKKITEDGLHNSSATLLLEGAILMTSRATVGVMAIARQPIATNQGFISLECHFPSNLYMLNCLQRIKGQIQSLATGSTFPEISRGVFREIRVLIPDVGVHDRFVERIVPMYDEIYRLQKENEKLVQMRDLFLPKVMKGEVEV